MAVKSNIEGQVFVKFTVDEKGDAQNAQILRGIGAGCDEEAIRVITTYAKFRPQTV